MRTFSAYEYIHFSTRLVYTLGHAREMRLSVLHQIIDILILFRRGSRKFCQRVSNSATLTIYFFRGERIQIPLKAGQHRPASETPFNSSLDVASDVGVNLCNVKSCLNTSKNEIFTDKRGDLPCVNISKHTCPVVK